MIDEPVDLDEHRSSTGMIATNLRRHSLKKFEADQASLRQMQSELEIQLAVEPAETWPDAAKKAQYLIRLFAHTAEGRDARRRKLIDRALADLARLIEEKGDAS